MERGGGNNTRPKWIPVPARNMQQYPVTNNNTVPLSAPVPVPVMTAGSADPNQNRDAGPGPNPVHVQARAPAREQDQYLPIANVIRIMRRILPPHAKISDEAKETVQECVSEYISFVTGEANERCRSEQRKTVTAEDVLWAMTKLGFDNYISPLSLYLNRYRELESDRNSGGNPDHPVTGKRRAAEYRPLMPAPAYSTPPPFSVMPGMFYGPAPDGGEYFVPLDGSSAGAGAGASGGASSSGQGNGGAVMPSNFDPFAPFK